MSDDQRRRDEDRTADMRRERQEDYEAEVARRQRELGWYDFGSQTSAADAAWQHDFDRRTRRHDQFMEDFDEQRRLCDEVHELRRECIAEIQSNYLARPDSPIPGMSDDAYYFMTLAMHHSSTADDAIRREKAAFWVDEMKASDVGSPGFHGKLMRIRVEVALTPSLQDRSPDLTRKLDLLMDKVRQLQALQKRIDAYDPYA